MRNRSCPYCSGRRPIVGETDLESAFPKLAIEWHPTKNGQLAPKNVTKSAGKKVWWRCAKGHEWQATISNRSNGTGCPFCAGHKPIVGETDLATVNPRLAAEWHPIKNGNLKPKDVTKSSEKKVWWQCNKGHEWQASVNSRSDGKGCPYCAGNKPIVGETDLATVNPGLATEWHPTKNKNLTPEDVTGFSNKRVWWRCSKGHEWAAIVNDRSKGYGCPYCSGKKKYKMR